MTLGVLLLTIGLALASVEAWAQWGLRRGRALLPDERAGPPPVPGPAAALGCAVIALMVGGPVVAQWSGTSPPEPPVEISLSQVQASFGLNLLLTGMLIGLLRGLAADLPACGLHLREPAGQLRDAWFGFRLAIGPVFAVLIVSQAIGLRSDQPEHAFLRLLLTDGEWRNWLWISLAAVIAAPLAEELLFRVLLQGWLESRAPRALAIACSSTLFCAVHEFPDSLGLVPLALVLGWLHSRRRSYGTLVLLHGMFNAANLLLAALGA